MSEIREMQLEIVSMMKEVDALFTEHNIKYTLLGGSVLGAIRHNGFIPWDDDMDIGVLRKDFDQAEQLLSKNKKYVYEAAEKHIIPDAPIGHLHLVNEKYAIENSPTIDLFALDKVPSEKRARKRLRLIANLHHLSVLRLPPRNRGKIQRIIIKIILFFAYAILAFLIVSIFLSVSFPYSKVIAFLVLVVMVAIYDVALSFFITEINKRFSKILF